MSAGRAAIIDLSKVWAVVRMERRNTRRLVRYWVFLAIAYLIALLAWGYYGAIHSLLSAVSASVGMIGPRYLMGAIGLYYLLGYTFGIVFLGFDIRARDVRDGIVEVLDARPLTNLELVAGRFIALFLSGWIPIVILALLVQGLGYLLPLIGSVVGQPVEPWSLFGFVFLMAVPAISFAIGLVFIVTLLVRHRLVASLLTIGGIVGMYWGLFTAVGANASYFDFLGAAQTSFPSDLVPELMRPGGWTQRIAVLLLGLGFVGLAAAIHPRLDGQNRMRPAAASGALVIVGLIAIAFVVQLRHAEIDNFKRWRAAHEARVSEPVADILAVDGSITINPGQRLDADLSIELAAPADRALERVLLTLNPGFSIDELTLAGGRALANTHADGLLDIDLGQTLAPGEQTTLHLRYGGKPDIAFGYLDSTIVTEDLNLNEAQVVLLGYERGLFDRRFVALTPGMYWLPASGVDIGRDDPRARRADYFTVALDVDLPAGWLAAGPGRRQAIAADGDREGFRFAPAIGIPEAALIASRFESFATDIRGITFEVLVDPAHDSNFAVLAEARGEIEDWIDERLEAAAEVGLNYPFDAFTIVEVPNTLRGFKGGWRLDTALAPPSMMLLRETSFPTARFDVDVVEIFGSRNYNQEGGKPRIERNRVLNFFINDFSGGNVLAAAARSFFSYRTSAYGDNAIAIDFALEQLSSLYVSGRRNYFSAHLFTNINQAANSVVASMQAGGGGFSLTSIADAIMTANISRTDVWNTVLQVPLGDVDPYENPQRTLDMLALKGGEMAEAMVDTLGTEEVGLLLARLLERHAGESFTMDDLIAAGGDASDGLAQLLRDWITTTGLPGFVVRGVEQYRLPDEDNGDPRYQLLVRLSNDEDVVGFARLSWVVPDDQGRAAILAQVSAAGGPGAGPIAVSGATTRTASGEPIRIDGRSAVEIGAVLNQPVLRVNVEPYLSLNRDQFVAGELNTTSIPTRDREPFEGVRDIPFDFPDDGRIIADDLDESFEIVTDTGEEGLRLAGRGTTTLLDLDQGLPVGLGLSPRDWSRRTLQTAYGRYRHTLAYVGAGDGSARAVMPVTIPSPGRWELEVHVPPLYPNFRQTWNLDIVTADGRESVRFNAAVSNTGWNSLGEFELPAGTVAVEVSNASDGRVVMADAIAWSPVSVRAQIQQESTQ